MPQPRTLSRLSRLFTYAKGESIYTLENFTTEALAIAVEADRLPMQTALELLDGDNASGIPWGQVRRLAPSTQEYVYSDGSAGFLDLVLAAMDAEEREVGRVWIEVKIDSPFGDGQLRGYQQAAALERPRPWLVALSKARPIDGAAPWLAWMKLYQAARRTPDENPVWRDLRKFLEEQMIASNAFGPISDAEAGALEAAAALLAKASVVVHTVHDRLKELSEPTRTVMTWRNKEFLNGAAENFRATGKFVTSGGHARYGLVADDGIAYWHVSIENGRLGATRREEFLQLAAEKGLTTAPWAPQVSGPDLLVARARATAFTGHLDAADWVFTRLRELDESGLHVEASRPGR